MAARQTVLKANGRRHAGSKLNGSSVAWRVWRPLRQTSNTLVVYGNMVAATVTASHNLRAGAALAAWHMEERRRGCSHPDGDSGGHVAAKFAS